MMSCSSSKTPPLENHLDRSFAAEARIALKYRLVHDKLERCLDLDCEWCWL